MSERWRETFVLCVLGGGVIWALVVPGGWVVLVPAVLALVILKAFWDWLGV